MKNLNLKRVTVAGFIAYAIGVTVFLASFFIPIMSNPKLQANLALTIAIVPASIVGARYYLKKGNRTKGLFLGIGMFLTAMILDAVITVPFFVIPEGGDHLSFFTDPGFWLIALLYVTTVTIYTRIKRRTALAKS